MIGQLLAKRYRVTQVKEIGKVYLAADTHRPQYPLCLIRHLPIANPAPSTQLVKRLLEKRVAALERLQAADAPHADRLPAHMAFFEENQELFLVESFIPGHPISRELQPGRSWTEGRVIRLLREVAEILEFVHGQGVIHQALQPANLVRRQTDNLLVLVNFMSAETFQVPGVNLQQRLLQTPIAFSPYTPIEQLQGNPCYNSDLYALGVIAIQALTGLPAECVSAPRSHNGSNGSTADWAKQVSVSRTLAKVVNQLVCSSAQDRYQSATELLAALRSLDQSLHSSEPILPSTAPSPIPLNLDDFVALRETAASPADPESALPVGLFSPLSADLSALGAPTAMPFGVERGKSWYRWRLPPVSARLKWVIAAAGLALVGLFAAQTHLPQRLLAHSAIDAGRAKRQQSDLKGAIQSFTWALHLHPTNREALYERGVTYAELAKPQQALDDLTQAIQQDANHASAYEQRGNIRLGIGDAPGAIEDYNQAIRLAPNQASMYLSRGKAYASLGEKQAALADFDRTIQLSSTLADAYLQRCLARSELNDQAGAIQDCTKAANLAPGLVSAYNRRGLAYRQAGNYQNAMTNFNIAIRLQPNDPKAYHYRGLVRHDLGDISGALIDFDKAAQLNHNYGSVYYDRALLRAELRDRAGALTDLQTAAKLCLDQGLTRCYQDAQHQIQQLQKLK
jgi:tetratricopeptide (TPR) repeat protein